MTIKNTVGNLTLLPLLYETDIDFQIELIHNKPSKLSFPPPSPTTMATIKAPIIRSILSRHFCSYCQRSTQRRWAQVHDVRFLATHRPQDAIIEKYKDKLDQKAKA